MKKITLFIFAISFVLSANAQFSRYLEKGKSGIGINAMAETSGSGKEFNGIGAEAGYTYKGKFDLFGMIVADGYDEKALGLSSDKATSKYYEVIVSYWLFREQIIPEIGVNFGLYAGYAGASYDGYKYLDMEHNDIAEYKSFSEGFLGITTSINFKLTESWYLEPSLKVRYEMGSDKTFDNNVTKTNDFNGVTQEIGLTLFKRLNKGNTFTAGTRLFSDSYEGSNFYHVFVGYIFVL
jgi:hypothetical protein